ncbi:DUF4376 domain-containing protein [Paraburkholderia aspalathi]|nr:DUF4376 domain-containing protein [Paraburkholderia aspalathi]
MGSNVKSVVHGAKIGTKGYPRHFAAFGVEPPTRVIDLDKELDVNGDAITLSIGEQISAERDRRIAAGAIVTIPDYGDVPIQGGGGHDRNMQALGQVALARIGSGDTTTITNFRDALNVMHELTPLQVQALWAGAVAATEAIYAASWVLKDAEIIPADFADDRYWP